MMQYKVLLTTSGVGSRLGDLTKFTNKSLVTIGNKPAIAHIVEQYPQQVEFVVTLGYFGSHIRQFLEIAYPNRNFTFVEVENYDGVGSSLGRSQLCARDHLRCPFIYNACDTIVSGSIPPVDHNWVGAKIGFGSSQYDSITVDADKNITSLHRKGYMDSTHIHIGLVGINDFDFYWKTMEKLYDAEPHKHSLSDVCAIEQMLSTGTSFKIVEFGEWCDIGNVVSLKKARERYKDKLNVLEKIEESISLVNGRIIKFFHNKEIITKRVKRSGLLGDLTPNIIDFKENFYAYDFVEGEVASLAITPKRMKDLIQWAEANLWKKRAYEGDFSKHCRYFYDTKTRSRIEAFFKNHNKDGEGFINGIKTPPVSQLLDKVPWEYLCDASPHQFHGDFILDNIVIDKNSNFKLLDWRDQFGNGSMESGDVYYDLAKMNHNLTVNHDIVCRELFYTSISKEKVFCDILRKDNLVKCNKIFFEEIEKYGYDVNKVEMLTGIVWLNMSPLHHRPFDEFLFYYGKLKLFLALENYYEQ
tara:strand:+ start:8412 stop:9992 length:1581 start_codon:yes stop_codon:yes gene_type:complete